VTPPEEIPESVFQEIYRDNLGYQEPETVPPETPEGEQQVPVEEQKPVGGLDPSLDNRLKQLEQMTMALLQNQGRPAQRTESTPQPSIHEELKSMVPDASKDSIDKMVKVVEHIANRVYMPQIQQLSGNIQNLQGAINRQESITQKTNFDQQLDHLMTQAKVTDTKEREVVRDAVVGRGWQRYGQQFTLQHVPALVREIVGNQRRALSAQTEQIVDEKENDMRTTPPVLTGQSGATGVESLRRQIRDPKRKDMDFTAEGFNKMVKDFLGATEKVAGNMLGGRGRPR
jgi:hypothetical protein